MLAAAGRRAAVLGSPIAHSLSPVLHRAAYAALGLDWVYDAIEVDAAGLPDFMSGLDDSWAGLSLTMPLKEAVLPLLDTTSRTARITGAANTVVLLPDKRVVDGRPVNRRAGHNTDVAGIVAAVRAAGATGFARATVIGAGATARSALAAAAQLGAREVRVIARRPEAAGGVLATAEAVGIACQVEGWGSAADALVADLVLSTVPGDAGRSLSDAVPARPRLLLDVTYEPWPTSLAAAWTAAGGRAVPGSQMLLWQAVRQVLLMTGTPGPVDAMAEALREALAARGTA